MGVFLCYTVRMRFEPLTTLDYGGKKLHVCGAEHDTRSDGSGSFMVAQAYISEVDAPVTSVFVDMVGDNWVATHEVEYGFHLTGIVLEKESKDV